MKLLFATLSVSFFVTPLTYAQQVQGDYLDVFIVKVRPEKRAEFDAVNRRIAEANRKAKETFGPLWRFSMAKATSFNS